jgi:hypothetical protein
MQDIVGRSCLFLVFFCGLFTPQDLRAQSEGTKRATAAAVQADPASLVPLGRYVAKENLLFYMEFAGLDAHGSSWSNTAACKMLNDTPLGEMLELVSGQLLDKALTFFPNRKLSGPEIVTLAKKAAKSGWVIALHVDPKAAYNGATIVLRGAAGKEAKSISSRLMGWMMGAEKPRIEHKDGGRTLVVMPYKATSPAAGATADGWVWWPEKNDLVISTSFTYEADKIIAALDGKAPSAVDHPLVLELKKPEGSFEPVCVGFVDVAKTPERPSAMTTLLHQVHADVGVNRIDLRWGFDGDALMSVTRVVAPKPWKSLLAVFDQPTFEKKSLMPMPDSVESFVELSISPAKLLETLEQLPGPAGTDFKAQIDALSESIKTAGSIDLKKDVLGHLGPRMVAYLASGRSATTNDDSLEAALKKGLSTTAAVTAIQTYFPKLTLVAEVDNPEAFGKGLDTAMIAINNELKAQAIEKEVEDRAATEKAAPGGAGRVAGGADRTKRRRKEPSFPHFQAMIGQVKPTNAGSLVKTFVLTTPTDSPLRFGPSSFRPTILLEDKHVAFAVSTDAARAAIAAAKRRDWKPSTELEQACEKVPSNMVMLAVNDVRESLSSLLASLPGTLQTMINTSIALAKAGASGATTGAGAGQRPSAPGLGGGEMSTSRGSRPGGPGGRMAGGPMTAPRPGAMMAPGGRPGGMGGGEGATGSSPAGTDSATSESMIVLKVDADKLPKAADLKTKIFPTTLSIGVAEQELRLVSRGAFPDLSVLVGMVAGAGMMPTTQSLFGQLQAAQATANAAGAADSAAAAPAAAAPGAPGNAGPPAGGPPGRRGSGRRPN